jgi:hypothetical protein
LSDLSPDSGAARLLASTRTCFACQAVSDSHEPRDALVVFARALHVAHDTWGAAGAAELATEAHGAASGGRQATPLRITVYFRIITLVAKCILAPTAHSLPIPTMAILDCIHASDGREGGVGSVCARSQVSRLPFCAQKRAARRLSQTVTRVPDRPVAWRGRQNITRRSTMTPMTDPDL